MNDLDASACPPRPLCAGAHGTVRRKRGRPARRLGRSRILCLRMVRPNTADPYECVAYDLRLLAEETDPDPRHTGGLVRHRTNYALAGFDYLTFAA